MNNEAETQRGRARTGRDLVGFESRPASSFDRYLVSPIITWGGVFSIGLGLLYLLDGNTLPGYGLIIVGALFAKAAHEAR